MPNAGQGWANWAYACCVRNICRGESNHLPVRPVAAAGTPGNTATVASRQSHTVALPHFPSPHAPPCISPLLALLGSRCSGFAAVFLVNFGAPRCLLACIFQNLWGHSRTHTHTQNNSSQSQKKGHCEFSWGFFRLCGA